LTVPQLSVPFGNRKDRHKEASEGPGVHAVSKSRFTEEQMAYALK